MAVTRQTFLVVTAGLVELSSSTGMVFKKRASQTTVTLNSNAAGGEAGKRRQAGAPRQAGLPHTASMEGGRSKPRRPQSSQVPPLHLTKGETETQRGRMSHPRSHAWEWQGWDANPGVCGSSPRLFTVTRPSPPMPPGPFLTLERVHCNGRDW